MSTRVVIKRILNIFSTKSLMKIAVENSTTFMSEVYLFIISPYEVVSKNLIALLRIPLNNLS